MAARKIPTVPQRALASSLERRREAAGLSPRAVAARLEWSETKVWRIETARVTVSPGDIRELARLYSIDDAGTEALVQLARQAKRAGWWKGMSQALPEGFSVHIELESTATAIRTYEAQWVPGLWQTEAYARAVLAANSLTSTPEQIERQVQVRMRRQQDRKSTRLNSSHMSISYAVFCLKKKNSTIAFHPLCFGHDTTILIYHR